MPTGSLRTAPGAGGAGREELGGSGEERGTDRSRGAEPCVWRGAGASVGVRAPSPPLPPPPAAPHVLFTCLSACDRDTFIFIACTFEHIYNASAQTHQNLPGHAPARVVQTPRLSERFRKAREVDFGIRSGTRVKKKKKRPLLLRHSFRDTLLTSGASWELKAEKRTWPGWEVGSGL